MVIIILKIKERNYDLFKKLLKWIATKSRISPSHKQLTVLWKN